MHLEFQERRVHVLRAVAEGIEHRHGHDHVTQQLPASTHGFHHAAAHAGPRALFEHRRLRHAAAQVQHQQRRQDAQREHAAPADRVEQQAVRDRAQQIAAWVTRLQDSRHDAARLRGDRFHRQRCAGSPLATHRDPEQRAQHQQHHQRRRERASEPEHGIQRHVDHQDAAAPVTIGQPSENQRAQWPESQRQQQGESHVRHVDVERLRHRRHHHHQQEVIECVQGPAEEGGRNGMPLGAVEGAQIGKCGHERFPCWQRLRSGEHSAARKRSARARTTIRR